MNNILFYGVIPTNFKNILTTLGYTLFPTITTIKFDDIVITYPSTDYPIVIINTSISIQTLTSFNTSGYILWFCNINHIPRDSFKEQFKGSSYGYVVSNYYQKLNNYIEGYVEELKVQIANTTTSSQVINPTPTSYTPLLITYVSSFNLPGSDGVAHSAGVLENVELMDGSFLKKAFFWVGGIIDADKSDALIVFYEDLIELSKNLGVPPYYVEGSIKSLTGDPLVRSVLVINTLKTNKTTKTVSDSNGNFRADLQYPDPVCIIYIPEGSEKPDIHYGITPKRVIQ